jgi:hypothetical protein
VDIGRPVALVPAKLTSRRPEMRGHPASHVRPHANRAPHRPSEHVLPELNLGRILFARSSTSVGSSWTSRNAGVNPLRASARTRMKHRTALLSASSPNSTSVRSSRPASERLLPEVNLGQILSPAQKSTSVRSSLPSHPGAQPRSDPLSRTSTSVGSFGSFTFFFLLEPGIGPRVPRVCALVNRVDGVCRNEFLRHQSGGA